MTTPTISSFTGTGNALGIQLNWSGSNIITYDISRAFYISQDYSGNEIVETGLPSTDNSYLDLDVSLNGIYGYYLIGGNNTDPSAQRLVNLSTPYGAPHSLDKNYDYDNNTFKLTWKNDRVFVDSTNNLPFPDNSGTFVSWDISCQRWDFSGNTTIIDSSSVIIDGISGEELISKDEILSNANFTTITDFFKTDCSYNFYIRADYSNNKVKETSNYSSVLTLDLTADVPSNFQINLSDADSYVNFSWDPTTSPGIPVSYDISFSDTSDNSGVLLDILTTTKKITGRDYVPSAYNAVVSAKYKNNMGYSKWSSSKAFTTPYYAPEGFKVTTFDEFDNESINLVTDVSYNKLEWEDLCGNINGWEIDKTIIDVSGVTHDSSYNLTNPGDISYNDDVSMNGIIALSQIYNYKVRALYQDTSGIWTNQLSLDIGWEVPSGIVVDYEKKGKANIYGVFKWPAIIHPSILALSNPSLYYVEYKVKINGKTYLAPNPTFSIYLSPGCGKTCVQIRAVYKQNGYTAMSEWSEEICVNNPGDLYCNNPNNLPVTKTQNNISSKMRYANAIKNIRGASSYKGTYIGGWSGRFK